jgi:phosphate-selective porin OprO/OprP
MSARLQKYGLRAISRGPGIAGCAYRPPSAARCSTAPAGAGAVLPGCCLLGFLCLAAAASPALGDDAEGASPPAAKGRFSYGNQGLQFEDGTGDNFLWFGVRAQTRWTGASVVEDELPGAPVSDSGEIAINRARLKLGGHLFSPRFKVYTEYDLVGTRLLDLRATYRFADALSLRVGQWKSEFNRERVDSSGKQQFAERSVVTPWFTIDRQQGVVASGRLGAESRADASYWFGWLTGAGRGGDAGDADGLWLARAQWNVNGRVLAFSQGALGRPPDPAGSVAIAAVTGRSGFTAFSSAGGGQLPGFTQGAPDQYRLKQLMMETAYQHGGFSWQQELHWKAVDDTRTGRSVRLLGAYAQAGMFFSELYEAFPEPLELAVRVAGVDPDRALANAQESELTVGANWYFQGHRNKLTLDTSRLVRRLATENDRTVRVRLQWDVSF